VCFPTSIVSVRRLMPIDLRVTDSMLSWTRENTGTAGWPGTDELLERFMRLRDADPEEMANFVGEYGAPELCQHGRPDHHDAVGGRACPFAGEDQGQRSISITHLRRAARAFAAARELGQQLRVRRAGDPRLWADLQLLLLSGSPGGDWCRGRRLLAKWLTTLLAECDVRPLARWPGGAMSLSVVPEARGLLGVLAVLLQRDLQAGADYTCDICHSPVPRKRAPRPGEGVYCDSPGCKREQSRRNQAAWRARTKGPGA